MLSRNAIKALMSAGLIRVTPEPVSIGPNSIDLRLGDELFYYDEVQNRIHVTDPVHKIRYLALNPKQPPPLVPLPKLADGRWLLVPGRFHLGVTLEETFCKGVVPHLDGRSTCGRLSIEAHKTAGVGDNGFQGRWTLEIEATEPVIVAPGDRLFQIYFTPCWGAGLAHFIQSKADGSPVRLNPEDPNFVDLLWRNDENPDWLNPLGGIRSTDPLLELEDLYGGPGAHYRNSAHARGPAPLD